MTQDQFEPESHQDLSADMGESFDPAPSAPPKRRSRLPFILTLLVAVAGTLIVVYQLFLGGGESLRPIEVAQTPATAPEMPVVPAPEQATLPEGVTPAPAPDMGLNVAQMVANANGETPPAPTATTEQPVAPATETPTNASTENSSTEVAALPEPVAPVAEEKTPETAMADAPPVVEEKAPEAAATETPAVVKPAPATEEKPAETAKAETPAPVPAATVTAETPTPVTPEPAKAEETQKTAAAETAPVMPAPAKEQLKPVEATPAVDTKTADKVAAINDILGKDVATPEIKKAQEQAMLAPAEVTPRAKQVIIVKRAYSAQSPQAINAAGDRVLAAGQYEDAATLYGRQLQNNPSDPLALAGKALALQKAGRIDEAAKVYDRLLQLNPRDLEALTNSLGLLQQQDPQRALGRLQALSLQYPDNATVAGQLAMAQAKMMDTPSALRSFSKAMALDPSNPIYPFNMGVLYDRLGTTDKAREQYRRALDVANAYPDRAGEAPLDIARQRLQAMN